MIANHDCDTIRGILINAQVMKKDQQNHFIPKEIVLEVIDKRNYELTNDLIEDRAYNMLYARKYDEELENTLRTMRAEAFVEFKNLD